MDLYCSLVYCKEENAALGLYDNNILTTATV